MHTKDSGNILLTPEDHSEFLAGRVSDRLKELWGLSYEELQHAVHNNNYRIIDGSEITRPKDDSGETS